MATNISEVSEKTFDYVVIGGGVSAITLCLVDVPELVCS